MGFDPHNLLAQVHPDLVKVANAAAQAPQPFQIVYGLRTLAEEEEAVASGHSETLHSRHLADAAYPMPGATCTADGGPSAAYAMAFDFAVLVDGQINWTVANAAGGAYGIAAAQIMAAAVRLGVKIQWGGQAVGAWVDGEPSHFRDWGHIQLDPTAYP